jgi:superfamily II DNA or RNA helicase
VTSSLGAVGTFSDLWAKFDPNDNRQRGKQFEYVCQWFLQNDPTYQPLLRRVWLWDDWPGRRGIDAGIDLVAEDNDGKLWAIQAKAYAPTHSISKRDVDKFVAESSRSKFTHRLLIATTDSRHHIATRLMDDLGIPFIGLTQLREADDYLDWPGTPAALMPMKPRRPHTPWDYQRVAINDVVEGFTKSDRGQLIMACGTGKTLTAWFITERLKAERVLVLVPSLSLLKQTMREWQTANPGKPLAALPVCSDETVGSLGEDAAVSHTSDMGVPVTTDPALIAEFLRKRSGPRVVFSTYQSSPQIAAAFKLGRVPQFDLVIADEAHRCAGSVSSDFATVLDPEEIRARRRLFMTATPRYFTGRILREAKDADYEIASMDDHTRFGDVFHRLSFSEAIDRKLLTDYQVAIIGVDDATYLDWAERGALVTLDGKKITDAGSLAGQIGLAKAMRKFDLHRVISFHGRVKAAREFAASMPAVLDWMPARHRPKGSLWSNYASGEMSAGERATLIQHLKRLDDGERGLLANARCLAEGVDVPALDGVAFIDPRRAEVDIVQAVGRAIRKSKTKTIGTVVIPVFIDTDEDAQVALDSSAFKPVWDVIKALRAHDTELGEQLDALRREMGRKGGRPQLPSKIRVDVPASVGEDFVNAFRVHVVDATTAPWEFWFGLLEGYVAEHGHARPSYTFNVGSNRLGGWVAKQRSHYNSGRLSQERQQRLEVLPGWTWTPRDALWEEGFARLQDYVAQSGTARVQKDCVFNGFQVGAWVTTQRSARSGGELPAERMQRLEALPGWTWNTRSDKWSLRYALLKKYVAEHGHTRPAAKEMYDGIRLGQWVAQQRYRRNKGNLDPVRVRLLEEFPDWIWDAVTDQWEEGFRHLLEYVDQCGDALVSQSFRSADGYKLGPWVNIQRAVYRDGEMSEERRARLEGLPGWSWDPRDFQWEYWYSALKDHVRAKGSARVPRSKRGAGEADQLANWVQTQRSRYAKGSMRQDRATRLEALPGWVWDPHESGWEEGFAKLQDYAAIHGDCIVLHSLVHDGYRLGSWINNQRTNYSKGTLKPEYAKRLESLPGWVWDVKESMWEEGFRHLVDYMKDHKSATPPPKYRLGDYSLGSWVGTQRASYRTGRLSNERARRLEGLSGWVWDTHADQWERTYKLVKQYADRHGTARVPSGYSVDGVRVESWIRTQKGAHRKGKLSSERQCSLEKLPGWTWTPSEDDWEERYALLEQFVAREGHARVPQKHVEQGIRLGIWVSVQRRDAFADVMRPERRERLEALPGWAWHVRAPKPKP